MSVKNNLKSTTNSFPGHFDTLPDELILKVFSELDLKTITTVLLFVSKRWSILSQDKKLWNCCFEEESKRGKLNKDNFPLTWMRLSEKKYSYEVYPLPQGMKILESIHSSKMENFFFLFKQNKELQIGSVNFLKDSFILKTHDYKVEQLIVSFCRKSRLSLKRQILGTIEQKKFTFSCGGEEKTHFSSTLACSILKGIPLFRLNLSKQFSLKSFKLHQNKAYAFGVNNKKFFLKTFNLETKQKESFEVCSGDKKPTFLGVYKKYGLFLLKKKKCFKFAKLSLIQNGKLNCFYKKSLKNRSVFFLQLKDDLIIFNLLRTLPAQCVTYALSLYSSLKPFLVTLQNERYLGAQSGKILTLGKGELIVRDLFH